MSVNTVARPSRGGTGPGDWIPSSRTNPCPTCDRTKDGDCRVSADGQRVICHHPKDLKPGEVVNGFAFTGNNERGGHFVIDVPRDGTPRQPRSAARRKPAPQPPAPAPLPDSITLARLPEPFPAAPPDHFPQGHRIDYGPDQWTHWEEGTHTGRNGEVKDKGERPRHRTADGKTVYKANDPWPLFGAELLHHAKGQWIAAAEGPKCALWLQAGGLVAVSQPGHDHKDASIRRRFEELQAAGVAGMAYLSDHDETGRKKAAQLAQCAAAVGFPFLEVLAADVWPEIPKRGSIDDAHGTAADRVAAIEAAVERALEQQPEPEGPAAVEYSAPRVLLARLREMAAELIASKTPYAERLPILRAEAEVLGITIRDQELGAMLTAARRATTGSDQPVMPGQWLDVTPTPWLWENVVMRGRLNLFIALPKQGKTSVLLAGIAAHHRNEPAFIDRTLIGPCPPVLIIGTDQGGNDWGDMLVEHGLAERHGNRVRYGAPIVALHHAGAPLHLDPEGIDRIAAYAQQTPGLLIVIDSLSSCVAPLGLKEESPQIAEPIHDLMQQVEPHGATVVLIHHAGKGRAGDGASLASRGSTALPAVASQTIKLGPASSSPNDRRRLLTTEGRGGSPQALVIKRDGGAWNYIGTAEVLEQEQAEADGIKGLNDRQADALDLVRERWEDGMQRTAATEVVEGLGLTGKDPATLALRTLKQLERKGFLSSIQTKGGDQARGRPSYEFWPVSAASTSRARTGATEPPSEMSEMSEISLAPEDPKGSNHCPVGVSDISDISDTLSLELGGPSETPSETVGKTRTVSRRTVLAVGTLVEVLIGNPPAWVNGHRIAANEGSHVRVVSTDDPTDWRVLPVEKVWPCSAPDPSA